MKQFKVNNLFIMVLGLLLFASCQKDDDKNLPTDVKYNYLPGKYKITAIQSAQLIDLKGDGKLSTDLYRQMTEPIYIDKEKKAISYPVTDPGNILSEIRPVNGFGQQDIPLAIFWFPLPDIIQKLDGSQGWELNNYTDSSISCRYELDSEGNVRLADMKGDSRYPFNKINSLDRENLDIFKLYMTVNLFDFSINNWALTDVVITFERIG